MSITNTKVLEKELDWHRHKVKEAIHIRQRFPTMNRDQGYQIPPIYDKIIPPMSDWAISPPGNQYVIRACRNKSKRHKFQTLVPKLEQFTTNYYDLPRNNLLEQMQSPYKKLHSRETALLSVRNYLLMAIDNKQLAIPILLGLIM